MATNKSKPKCRARPFWFWFRRFWFWFS